MFLKGTLVIDFSHYIPGPYATLRLSDFGAEIIKIEPPTGDLARAEVYPPEEQGLIFRANNPSKQSLSLDLKTSKGIAIAKRLIAKADVVIESFRPGVMDRLGLGYETIKNEVNSKIIYCSISGYGQQGEQAEFGSHDLNYMSVTGVLAQLKDKDGRPIHPTITLADSIGSMAASENILGALYNREKSGEGAYLDISLVDSLLALMNNHFVIEEEVGKKTGATALCGRLICYSLYETKDGRFVSLGALEKKFWEHFCQATHHPEWSSFHLSETDEANPIYQQLQHLFKSKTLQEWSAFSREIDCCLAPVLEVDEVKVKYAEGDRIFIKKDKDIGLQIATRYQQDFVQKRTRPPEKGEHTNHILTRHLKLSGEEIQLLKSQNILFGG
jgi:alpha-methylacyl-CoA racemase